MDEQLSATALFDSAHLATLPEEAGDAPDPFPSDGRDHPVLSFAQEQLWFLDQLEPGNPAYNIAASARFSGPLDVTALGLSLREIVRRHETLRTRVAVVDGRPVPVALENPVPPLSVTELHPDSQLQLDDTVREEARARFDLARGPLFRARLWRLGADDHLLVLSVHHIACDGWSVGVLVRELTSLYEAFVSGTAAALPESPTRYADFARCHRERVGSGALEDEFAYWRGRLAGAPVSLDLPTDRSRPPVQTFNGGRQPVALPPELAEALRAVGRAESCTSFMVLLAAFQALLSRYSGQEDLCVGTPVAGRGRPELEGLVGLFVNTLVLRADLSGDPSFREQLRRTREACLGAYAHQDLPFERLVEDLRPARDPSRPPLCQVLFAFNPDPARQFELPGLTVETGEVDTRTAKFDLSLYVTNSPAGLQGYFEYNTDLFAPDTIARLADHWQVLLKGIAVDPDRRLSELPLLTEPERHQLLVEWNDTRVPAPPQQCLHELFEAQAERTPEAVAVVWGEHDQTYRELNERANRLAHHLQALGVGPEVLVGVCLERSADLVVGLLGVLKAGGAYVPLDRTYPAGRLAFILEDARLAVLVTKDGLDEGLPDHAARVVRLDGDEPAISRRPGDNPGRKASGNNLAYVLYTSGSTGKPKGVAVEHRNAVAFADWARGLFTSEELSGVLASTSVGFDLSVFELFVPLSAGGTVILADDALALPSLPAASSVTLVNTVPSALTELLRLGGLPASVRTVNSGGEALPHALALEIYRQQTVRRLFDLYGPTEATVYSTWALVPRDPNATKTIGRPIANTRVYVLDRRLQPVPVGVPGELFIGGAGVARGYLNRPELTAERFVPDPFGSEPGGRLYRTADLARWLPGGELEYLGRMDYQVKVRGFRIELGEIEGSLIQHAAVREAVVTAREGSPGDRRLIAYVVPQEGAEITPRELREYLRERLPDYMVPAAFVALQALPLTPNGKVNRGALPATEPAAPDAGGEHVPPRTPVEEMVADAWAEVLGVDRVSVHDNFFELGGHSLLATQVIARLRDAFQTDLPLRALFEAPTVAGLAEWAGAAPRADEEVRLPPLRTTGHAGTAPVSFAQQRLWFLDRWEPGNPVYNIPAAVRFTGPLDVSALEWGLNEVVRRHESLRTTFTAEEGQPVQVISAASDVPLLVVDLRGLPPGPEAAARRLAAEEARRPFDLARGPLVRASLLQLGPEDHVVLLTVHHSVADGWSVGVLVRELSAFYRAFVGGDVATSPELSVQYADFAVWQRELLQGETLERQLAYWRRRLADAPTSLDLATDRPRPAVQTFRGGRQQVGLPAALTDRLRTLGRAENCTPFMVLLAAFQALLSRYTGQEDICVATPVAGRTRAETEGLIGLFVNTLVLRTDLTGDPPFRALLGRTRDVALGAYAHQDLPFEKLVEDLRPARDPSRPPLAQVMLALQNAPAHPLELPGLTLTPWDVDNGTAKFELTLSLTEGPDGLSGYLEYNADLFDPPTAERMVGHWRTLLEGVVADPGCRVSRLPLLTDVERRRVLVEWNDTAVTYPQEHVLPRLLEDQARRTPDAAACACAGRALTYGELDRLSAPLARRLRALGVGPDGSAGVFMERSVELMVGLWGVVRAGGAYVPLDPAYPAERLAFMLSDARPAVVLTQSHLAGCLPPTDAHVLYVDDLWDELVRESDDPLGDGGLSPDHLAYVIYTSGSTGRPKGAMNTHRAVCNRLLWMQEEYRLTAADVVLQKTPVSFDVSVWELFWPALAGARLVLARPEGHKDAGYLANLIREEGVTVCHFVPSMLRAFLEEPGLAERCHSLRNVVCSGEALPEDLARRFFERLPGARLHNLYGPTEAAVDVTFWECRPYTPGPVPIGRPVANTRMYVLDRHFQPVPAGVPGELHIGGVQVARGYLNRPELTAERFVPDPFGGEPGGRLYRTGDLGRWRPDGVLEYLGRTDHQVKIRGFRIELGEIEAALGQHPEVRAAVVVAREASPGDSRLVAYVVPQGEAPTATELRAYLRDRLPEYMVPAAFVTLEALPLNPSGKVDRKALPPAEWGGLGGYVAPRGPIEEAVAGIFAELLGVQRIGAHDDFFELGGHSLLATQAVARVRQTFRVELRLRDLFERPTVAGVAQRIEEALRTCQVPPTPPLRPVSREGPLPPSFAQQRLWFLDQWEPASPLYNIATALRLTGSLDVPALERSLNEVVRRHEVLRTTFATADGHPVQVVAPDPELPLTVTDLGSLPEAGREAEAWRLAAAEVRRPFDLARTPLMRCALLRLAADDHVAVLTLHHIAADGWSLGVLQRELAGLYGAYAAGRPSPLPELPVQYADYAAWQRQGLNGETLGQQLAYWREQLAGAPAALDLPTDRPRPTTLSYAGAALPVELPAGLADRLGTVGRAEGCTPFMVLLAGFQALLSRYTGQEDICVGTPIAGRTRAETEGLIGLFVNTLVLRTDLTGDPTFRQLLGRVREACLGAYAHQDLPFERLVEDLRPTRDPSRPPLAQVMLVLQNTPAPIPELPGLRATPWQVDTGTSKFDLTLRLADGEDGLTGELEYSTAIFDPPTVQRLVDHWRELLEAVADNPDLALSGLPPASGAPGTPPPKAKADRTDTPPAGGDLASREYVAPRGPVEEAVARIFSEVLEVRRVGARDNFFELGGHSLLATQALSRIRQAFPVDLPLRRLFEEPTVENLARVIADGHNGHENGQDRIAPARADQLLARLDYLSDEEVDALLGDALAEEEVSR